MTLKVFFHKLNNRWTKLRLQPIRVFCIHQVSDTFDESTMWKCDWTQTENFKRNILALKERYTFISLPQAQELLRNDWFRYKKYAVLTADDGFASMKQIVPWLVEQQIPITLFINPIVWNGKTIGQNLLELPIAKQEEKWKELYCSLEDLQAMESPLITFGYHGYEHIDEYKESYDTFVANFEKGKAAMATLKNVIPFYVHTYGHATQKNDVYLMNQGITPLLVRGGKNYNQGQYLDRELL